MKLQHIFPYFIIIAIVVSCQTQKQATKPDEGALRVEEDVPAPDTVSKNLLREKEWELSNYQGSRERKFDLIHSSLDLGFDYAGQQVNGRAVLTLKPYFYEQETVELDAKDFDIHDVWLDREQGEVPLSIQYNQKRVTIHLPHKFSAGDTIRIGMRYTAKPNENSGEGSGAITDNKGLYFINPENKENKPVQIWTQGETEHNSKWFPTIDSPNERGTQDIRLTVEEKYLTLSNGKLISQNDNGDGTRTDHWAMDLPHAPYLAAVVIGEFAKIEEDYNGLPIAYYVEEKYEEGAKKVFGNTPEMIGVFSELLGVDFPWQKYDQVVVRDFVSGAMENTTLSVFMEALLLNEREAIDSEWDYIIAHELFHQWFGNYVTTESWSNLPLNEAFADYSEYLWLEHKRGRDEADMHHIVAMESYMNEAREKQEDLIRFYYEDKEDMFDSHSYAKGGRVLHMLRKYLGDEAFFGSLKFYLEQNAFSSVEVHDLRLAFEKVTGQDLNWFFNRWFLDSGHPVLDIQVDFSQPENLLLTVEQKQDLQTAPLYRIPFQVSWYEGGVRSEKQFVLDQGIQQFALENGGSPDLVLFDEYMEVLAEKPSNRGKEHFKKQLTWSVSGLARYEALDSLTVEAIEDEQVQALVARALEDDFSSVRELALARLQRHRGIIPVSEELELIILDLAEKDPVNAVRAGAIEVLQTIDKDKYGPLFTRLIHDPSYYVAGAALTAFISGDSKNKEQIIEAFLEENSIQMIVPLADYFTETEDRSREDWFHDKVNELSSESLYYFLGYYGDYFARMDDLDSEKAIDNLYRIGKENTANYIRFAAFQAMFGFIEDTGVLDKVNDLYQNEKDDNIRKYQEFFLESYED